MKLRIHTLLTPALGLAAFAGLAQNPAPKKFEAMDYGRFVSATFNNAEGKNTLGSTGARKDGAAPAKPYGCTADKGIAIKLENDSTVVFDTDLVRMAGGWSNGFIQLKGVVFEGGHGPNPGPAPGAKIVFQTNPTPGWSTDSTFADTRKLPTGPGAATRPFGPLPRELAKYKGLYLHGDQVVLSYTVGSASVLELPAAEKIGERGMLTRTFNVVGKGSQQASLLAAEAIDGAASQLLEDGKVAALADDPKNPDSRLLVALLNAPAGTQLAAGPARISVKLPRFAGGESFKVVYGRGTTADAAAFAADTARLSAPAKLAELTKGSAPHWTKTVTTKGELGTESNGFPYVVDSITPPLENPYNAWIRFGGLDFFSDGRAALSTWSGDVWIVSGVNGDLKELTWKRYATGLYQALGLKVVDNVVYVLGRDQITRLHDLNNDGEADFYENFNNDVQVTPGFHEFALDLHTDPQGNFYFAKGGPVNPGGRGWGPLSDHNGCIFKISKDGQKFEVYATGVRAPNGMGVGPKGEVTCGDNQGTWVPACYVHMAKQGEFIGVTDLAHLPTKPTAHSNHICYLPMDVDNSGGAQVWVTSKQWGPFENRLLHLSYGQATAHLILSEQVGDTLQGGAVKLPLKFETGVMRARFHPTDGQLYLTGLRGWQTKGGKDGAFYRVRYTGKPVTLQTSLRVTDKGIHLGFTNPVDAAAAADLQNYSIQQYNYRWTEAYGSPDFKPSNPEEKGRDDVEIKAVKVSADAKAVFLEVPGLKPVDQVRIKMNLKAADGADIPKEVVHTINAIGKE